MKKLLLCLFTGVLAQASTLNLPLEPFTNKFDVVVSDNFSYEELQQRNGKLFGGIPRAHSFGILIDTQWNVNLNNVPDDCVVLRGEKIRNVYNVEKWSEENGRCGILNKR